MSRDSRLKIPEPAANIGRGVLSNIWYSQGSLPKLGGLERVFYYLKRGIDTVTVLPMSNGIAIMTIAISLFLFSAFFLAIQNIDRIISYAGSNLYVTAYVKSDSSEEAVKRYMEELKKDKRVRFVDYITKERALEIFREELGVRHSFLDGLEKENPLPTSLELSLFPDELGLGEDGIIKRLRDNPLIDEVIYGSEWVEHMKKLLRVFRLVGYVSLAIILVIIVFLIANTIKLVIYARREEISIMQLVGASDTFVRVPFILGGMFQGVLGAVAGIALLRIVYLIVNYEMQYATLFGVALPNLYFLSPLALLCILLLGMVVGSVGSLLALGRFMNV